MKQILTKSILISIISCSVFANPISSSFFSISSIFSNLKGKNATGINIATGYNSYKILFSIKSGSFKQKTIQLTTPFYLFTQYSYINLNKKYNDTYFGIYYYYQFLNPYFLSKYMDVSSKNNIFEGLKVGISPKGHKLLSLSYVLSHGFQKNYYLNFKISATRYFSIGNKITTGIALEKDF